MASPAQGTVIQPRVASLASVFLRSKRATQALAIMSLYSIQQGGRREGEEANGLISVVKKVSKCLHVVYPLVSPWPESSPWSHTAARKAERRTLDSGGPCASYVRSLITVEEGAVDVGCQLMGCHKWWG